MQLMDWRSFLSSWGRWIVWSGWVMSSKQCECVPRMSDHWGASRAPGHYTRLFSVSLPTAPWLRGQRTLLVNWASMVADTHSLSPYLTDMQGGPVCTEQSQMWPMIALLAPNHPSAILLPSGAFQSHMDEPCGIYLAAISRITQIELA